MLPEALVPAPAPDIVPWLPLIAGVLIALVSLAGVIYLRVRGERGPLPPTWPEMWKEIRDTQEAFRLFKERTSRRDVAFANILRAAAEQWPADRPGPQFADADLKALEDTMPPQWLKRRRRPRIT